ncbi:MAG: ABC transporter ATP-binding protein [Lachnospiraceae bacterium]|jgi:ATP-binding cassette subfamily B protein|nr:ABC transporter ATP-binding protein [Lachnospiraceae bacterium]
MVRRILSEVKEYTLPSLITPLCMILEVAMEMVVPYLMASIIDYGVYAGNMNHILKTGLFMVLAAIVGFIGGILGGKFGAVASTGLARNLRKSMYENIQTFSFSNIDKFSTSSLITRLTTDVTNIQNSYQMILRMAMRAPASLIAAMFMAFYINARIARIYLIAVFILAIFLVCIMLSATKIFRQAFPKYDELNESVQENVTAIRVVKAYVREDEQISRFKKASQAIYQIFCKAEGKVVLNGPVMTLTVYTCILTISWIGAKMISVGDLTTGELMSLLAYCMNILMSLMMLSMIFVMITMSAASAERIVEVLNEESDLKNPENPITEVKDGSVSFKNAAFAYNYDKGGKPVLENINLEIKSGETIGIMGATGSSKSTLVSLISRLYDVTEGSVSVGGVNVKEYDLEVLRNAVSVVLQKNQLFSGTILDNLRWGKEDATEEECINACKMACADEFISRMPDGYNTRIEQGGSNVSGGQKQRLCIARALLKSPRILILDDSTSAVDTATDAKIREAFRTMIPGVTKFIIAQRISSIQDADRIIVLDNGHVNGIGTHDELLKNNEIYREVYESQTGGSGDFDETEVD